MTEEYKKNLLDYFTGDLETGTPTIDEIIKEQIEANRNDWVDFLPSTWSRFNFEGLISANENTSNLNILYGGYCTTGNEFDAKGVIILLDVDFKPIKAFYQYDSGTDLRYIQHMEQNEDGTFYMIDDTCFSEVAWYLNDFKDGIRRFVMLNNFSIAIDNQYKISLQKSYIFGTDYNDFYCRDIYKDPNKSHYVFLGKYYSSNKNNTKTISLLINVGSPNEWEYINTTNYDYCGGFVMFDEDSDYLVRLIVVRLNQLQNYFTTGEKDYSSSSYSFSNVGNFDYNFDIDTQDYNSQVVFLNQNEAYIVGNNQIRQIGSAPYDKYIGLYYYNFSTEELSTIYEEFIETAGSISKRAIYIAKHNNELYLQYNTNISDNYTADYYYQRLVNNTWDPIFIKNDKFWALHRNIFVNSKYNLLNIFLITTMPSNALWYNLQMKEVYNQNQYNGEPYISVDSLVPKYVNLYDNNHLVFSRNVYNTTKQNNSTTSSVEIPNNYLNNNIITENDLISTTNLEMNSNQTHWNKNVYEVVDLNFINTINIKDEDTNTQYVNGAIRLNNAITDGGASNYTNSPCIKYRINYMDDTTDTGSISWINISEMEKETTFNISVSKAIKDIDLTSYDGNTIYLTILGTFEVGKNYRINQKVRIGSKSSEQDLVYNGEDIFYDGEQVKVYIN